jgi:hypothetical protein
LSVLRFDAETRLDERQGTAISLAAGQLSVDRDAADHIAAQINRALMRPAVRSQSGIPDPVNRPESIGWTHAL